MVIHYFFAIYVYWIVQNVGVGLIEIFSINRYFIHCGFDYCVFKYCGNITEFINHINKGEPVLIMQ